MDGQKVRRVSVRILARFFLAMVFFTVLSRALDSITVAKVAVTYPKQGKVFYEIKGEGILKGEDFVFVSLPADMRVEKLHKSPGQTVSAGEELVTFQQEAIKEQKDSLETQLLQAQLLLEEEIINAVPLPELSQEALALQEFQYAERELLLGREKLQKAQVDYTEKTSDLKEEYERNLERSDERIRSDGRSGYQSAKRAYENALLTQESQIKKGKRQVEDKEKELDQLVEEGASQEKIDAAETALLRAIEDLEEIEEEQELHVEDARERMYEAEDDDGDERYDRQEAREDLSKAYDEALEAEGEKLDLAYEQVKSLEIALEKAQTNLGNARIRDQNQADASLKSQQLSLLRQRSLKLNVSEIRQQLLKLEDLELRQGRLLSPADGTVSAMDLVPGEIMSGEKQIAIAQGNLILEGSIDKADGELIREGAKLDVKTGGSERGYEAIVQSMDPVSEDGRVLLKARMPEGIGHLGASAGFSCSVESGPFRKVIPVEALREDSKGFYCLSMEPERTILGEELIAVRIPLDLLEKSSTDAAVEGAFTNQSKVVLTSDKPVSEGDRVRVDSQ